MPTLGVGSRMRRLAALLAFALVACGGSQKKGTTPGDTNGGSSLISQKNPDAPFTGAAEPGKPGERPKEENQPREDIEPPPPKKEPPKPPGQDLPADEKNRIIKSRLALGNEAAKKFDSDGMIREAMGVLDVEETNSDAMILLAHGYYLKGNLDKAEAVLNEALKQESARGKGKLWMLFGLIYDKTQREDAALLAYTKATDANPNYAAAWTNRGVIMQKRKVFAGDGGSVACFEKALQLIGRNRSAKAHAHLGSAYRGLSTDQKGEREELLRKAETELKAAITVDPNFAPAYFNLGLLYFDADPYPGMDKLQRLSMAMRYLKEYQRVLGPTYKPGDKVEEYLTTAQKAYDQEEKAIKRKKEKEEKDRLKKEKQKQKEGAAAPAGGEQQPPPQQPQQPQQPAAQPAPGGGQ
jgi:tetratricopeptide (TPR) repeat protein